MPMPPHRSTSVRKLTHEASPMSLHNHHCLYSLPSSSPGIGEVIPTAFPIRVNVDVGRCGVLQYVGAPKQSWSVGGVIALVEAGWF
jgi:hypothetical protein